MQPSVRFLVIHEIIRKFTNIFDILSNYSLKLPEFDIKMRKETSGRIEVYDRLRGRFVALTPEEWVRQHFVNMLVEHLGYPPTLMANEVGIEHNSLRRRCDTVIYDRRCRPAAIVEYKAVTVNITPKVFDQIVRYNMVMGVKWLMVSNGDSIYCCRVEPDGSYRFVKGIPSYEELCK